MRFNKKNTSKKSAVLSGDPHPPWRPYAAMMAPGVAPHSTSTGSFHLHSNETAVQPGDLKDFQEEGWSNTRSPTWGDFDRRLEAEGATYNPLIPMSTVAGKFLISYHPCPENSCATNQTFRKTWPEILLLQNLTVDLRHVLASRGKNTQLRPNFNKRIFNNIYRSTVYCTPYRLYASLFLKSYLWYLMNRMWCVWRFINWCINLCSAKMQHDTTWVDIIQANVREQDSVSVRNLVRSLHPPATPCTYCSLEFHLQSKLRCVPTIASAIHLVVVLSSLLAASTDWSPRSENRRLAERRSSETWKHRLKRTQWNHKESWSKQV